MSYVLLRLLPLVLITTTIHAATDSGVPAFRVTAPNGETSTLIGTMHVGYPGLRQPSPTMFEGARSFVIEHATIDVVKSDEPMSASLAPEVFSALLAGRDVRAAWAHDISAEQISAMLARINCSVVPPLDAATFEMFLKMRTARYVSTLAVLPCIPRGMLSRDDLLARAAAARNIPVIALETPREIDARRDAIPARIYEASFRFALRADLDKTYDELVAAFNLGDFDAVARYGLSGIDNAADAALFARIMIVERNHAWMPGLRAALDKGHAIVGVGAGHLAGKQGLLELLAREGYRVDHVSLPAIPSR